MSDYDFRTVTGNDLTMLSGWLNQLQISRWWPDPARQLHRIQQDLANAAMTQLIVMQDDTPLAFVRHYPARRVPAPQFAHLPHDTIALDQLSGPLGPQHVEGWLGQLGDRLLQEVSMLATDPTTNNVASVRAYRQAGFGGDVIRQNGDGRPVLVMTRRR